MYIKEKEIYSVYVSRIIQIAKKILLMIRNEEREGWHFLAEKPSEKEKIVEFNQHMNSDEIPYIVYANIESLIKKIEGCANNTENSLSTKISEHISCRYPMSAIWAFDHIENKHTFKK